MNESAEETRAGKSAFSAMSEGFGAPMGPFWTPMLNHAVAVEHAGFCLVNGPVKGSQ